MHTCIVEDGCAQDRLLSNLLVQMYGNCGSLMDACAVFEDISEPNIYSWTILIKAHTGNGHAADALELFSQMQAKGIKPNRISFICTLEACTELAALAEGQELHHSIIELGLEVDVDVGNTLINMYGKCRSLDKARVAFAKMQQRDVVSWSAMISVCAQNGHGQEALELFSQMQAEGVKANKVTFIGILDACASLASLQDGQSIHLKIIDCGFESDTVLGNTLLNMYGKCGSLADAMTVFVKMPQRSAVSWNAMIVAYSQNGHGKEALELFGQMLTEAVKPTKITFISILDACASVAALTEGQEIHDYLVDAGFDSDLFVGTALLNMYGKCGILKNARSIFDRMTQRNVVAWGAIISAFAQNGHGKEALHLFEQMKIDGVKPDKITFISVLTACSHNGLLEEGRKLFNSMEKDHDLSPSMDHYTCMIDILGRAGNLHEAEELIDKIPFEHSSPAWLSLLAGCRFHGDVNRGIRAADHLFELDPMGASPYVQLSYMFAAAGRWDDLAKVRKTMRENGLQNQPCRSFIEIERRVHEFVWDTSHPLKEKLYAKLEKLNRQMKEAGYVHDKNSMLYDVNDLGREHMLCHHSERLAIAFGLIRTPPGTPLRVTKNLRVCSDCHVVAKFISKLVQRKIFVRDAECYHHIENGVCSCGDYW